MRLASFPDQLPCVTVAVLPLPSWLTAETLLSDD